MKRSATQTAPRFLPTAEPDRDFEQRHDSEILPPRTEEDEKPDEFIRYLALLWERRRLLVRAAVVGLIAGIILAFAIPKRFESTAELMPPDSHSSAGMAMLAAINGHSNGLGDLAGELFGVNSSGALFIGILNSRTVEDRLIDRFDLRKIYHCSFQYQARRRLSENTRISEDRLSGIIIITVSDTSAQRAAAMAGAYVEELNRLVVQLATSSAHRERVFLEERLTAVKQDLDAASKQFSEFSSKNTAIDIHEQGRAMIDAAATLTGQLIAAESELHGLEQIYTPSNVRVRSIQARIVELRSQLERLGGTESGQNDTARHGTEKDVSDEDNNSLYPPLRKLPLIGVTYADLYRQTKIQETVYETLTQEYELAKVQEAKETPSVRVLDAPVVAEHKSSPPRLLLIILATALGFSGCALWIVVKSRWDEVESIDPAKVLVRNIVGTVRAHVALAANGAPINLLHRARLQFGKRNAPRNGTQPD